MAKRYRYAIIKKKEAKKGKLSVGLAIASLLLFVAAVGTAYALEGSYGFIVGGICLFATLLSVRWIPDGNRKFSENCNHRTSIVGTILAGFSCRLAALFPDGSLNYDGTIRKTDGIYSGSG